MAIVKVCGKGFGSKEKVIITFDAIQVAATITDGKGHFCTKFKVPKNATLGDHLVVCARRKQRGYR